MIAQDLKELLNTNGLSILDVMPWLTEASQYSPAFDLAEAWIYIDPIGSEFIDVLHIEESMANATLNAAYDSMDDVYQSLVSDYWTMAVDKFEKHSEKLMTKFLPAEPHWELDPQSFNWLPYEAYGEDWFNEEWIPPRGLENIMPIFGFQQTETGYKDCLENQKDIRWRTCAVLTNVLEADETVVNRNLAMFIRWAFNGTGNSLADWSEMALMETGQEYFTWNNLDLAYDIQMEADEIYQMVEAGIEALNSDPLYFNAFVSNYQTIFRSIAADYEYIEQSNRDFDYETFTREIQPQWINYSGESHGVLTKTQRCAGDIRLWRDPPQRADFLRY